MAQHSAMEGVELTMFSGCYAGRRVLLTGHTGFKGSWLALWLTSMGAEVRGLALPPATIPNHWSLLALDMGALEADVRDGRTLADAVAQFRPEIIFHLAAQSLVRVSYENPLQTWSVNVMGTAHLLEACRLSPGVLAVVVVTSDKCYENHESPQAYRETDRLGGHDPYSASKAGTELLAASYRQSFFQTGGPLLATARAGNVIGGGDWSRDRLIPDLVRAIEGGRTLEVRSPGATRPWQHVLESLSGYLLLGQRLLLGEASAASAWNFGPESDGMRTVESVLTGLQQHWPRLAWTATRNSHPHETTLLMLDSGKARQLLGWRPVWRLDRALEVTAGWYRDHLQSGRVASRANLEAYVSAARASSLEWARA